MRPKSMVLILIALGCGLIASIGISQVVERRNDQGAGTLETAEIFVASVDVPIGDSLSAQMVRLEEWPKDKIPNGAIGTFEDLEGRRPKQPLFEDTPEERRQQFEDHFGSLPSVDADLIKRLGRLR